MTARVTIALPDELLARLDEEAASFGRSRSSLVAEATASYLGRTPEQRADESRRARMRWAIDKAREMAQRNPMHDGRPSLEILREIRATDDSAPLPDAASAEER
jgi:metal-responsive CopG/Arc/MetJ family transcriptional regulator